MVKASRTYRLITDQIGSVRLVVDAETGSIEQEIEYDAFGRVTSDSAPGFQPFYFAGGLYDSATKLAHFGAWEYDAALGRWTSADPISFAGGDGNLYGYVALDPVNLVDPSGLLAIPVSGKPTTVLDVSKATGKTIGGCVGFAGSAGVSASADFCVAVTPNGQAGTLMTTGLGGGGPFSFEANFSGLFSSANCLEELVGTSTSVGGSAGIGPFSFGFEGETSRAENGNPVTSYMPSWAPGVRPGFNVDLERTETYIPYGTLGSCTC